MKKIIILSIFITTVAFVGFGCFDINIANGEGTQGSEGVLKDDVDDKPKPGVATLINPIKVSSIPALIGKIINSLMGIVGSLALLMFVYGGITWMTAAGSSERIQKGKNIIMWAVIGLVLIFSSYGLVKFILEGLG